MRRPDIRANKLKVYEALAEASAAVEQLPGSRAASLVATKLDEARLWLREVDHEPK